jgi:hypothetical protein
MSLSAQQQALKQAIVEGGAAPGVVGLLRVYQQAYAARLTAALRDNFGVVPRVLGDEAFDALARAYIAEHPSTHPSIRWFGDRLPAFMVRRDDLVPHPALVDLARLEWALRSAFDAADAPVLMADDLGSVAAQAWPELVFAPMPGLQLLRLQWKVGPAWRLLQGVGEPELPEPEPLDHDLLVWRQGLAPRWRTVEAREAGLLQRVIGGMAFGELCAWADDGSPDGDAAAQVASALRRWVADGLLRR